MPLWTRHFQSFHEAEAENAQSRIYLGIHWQFDAVMGIQQGNQVADYVFHHAFTPSMNRHPFTTSKEAGAGWTKARRTHYSPFRGEALDDDSANHIEQGREIGGRDCPAMRTVNPAGIQAASQCRRSRCHRSPSSRFGCARDRMPA
jgi:hypothetical protein